MLLFFLTWLNWTRFVGVWNKAQGQYNKLSLHIHLCNILPSKYPSLTIIWQVVVMLSNIKKRALMRFLAFMVHIRKYPLLNASNEEEKWWRHKILHLWNYGIGWLCTNGLTFWQKGFFHHVFSEYANHTHNFTNLNFCDVTLLLSIVFNMTSYGNYKSLCVIQSTLCILGHRCPVQTKARVPLAY